jgi:hypothetical protein
LKIGFSWFETDQPDLSMTEGCQNLGSPGNTSLTILFFKALRGGQPLKKNLKN